MKRNIVVFFLFILFSNNFIELTADIPSDQKKNDSSDQDLVIALIPTISLGVLAIVTAIGRQVKMIKNFNRFSQPIFDKINERLKSKGLDIKNQKFKKIIEGIQKTFGSRIEDLQKQLRIPEGDKTQKLADLADLIVDLNKALVANIKAEIPDMDFDFLHEIFNGVSFKLSKDDQNKLSRALEGKIKQSPKIDLALARKISAISSEVPSEETAELFDKIAEISVSEAAKRPSSESVTRKPTSSEAGESATSSEAGESATSSRIEKASVAGAGGSLLPTTPEVASGEFVLKQTPKMVKMKVARKIKAFIGKQGKDYLPGKKISDIDKYLSENLIGSLEDKAAGKPDKAADGAAKFIKKFIDDFQLYDNKKEALSILSDFIDEFLIEENNLDVKFIKELSKELGQSEDQILALLKKFDFDLKKLLNINNRIVEQGYSDVHRKISKDLSFETPIDFSDALTFDLQMKDVAALEHGNEIYSISRSPLTKSLVLGEKIELSRLDPKSKIAKYDPINKEFVAYEYKPAVKPATIPGKL